MREFFGDETQMERRVYTVSELTREIRGELEAHYPELWLEGEVSNFRAPAASGHLYFTLKDSGAQIKAVMFKGSLRSGLRFQLEDGLQVQAYGRVSVYEPRGEYQIVIERLEPKGLGALQLAFEQLKKRLGEEGLFAPERKRPLPAFPRKVAVVTSPTGAVIQDMLQITGRRCPWVDFVVLPVRVQGAGAAEEIAEAIALANQELQGEADLLVVARGGGSLEDLWAFNEEVVARAIAASALPVISAVGHEVDFTIADFVADQRAPTPSAAAEMLSISKEELKGQIQDLELRLQQATRGRLGWLEQSLQALGQRLQLASPKALLEQHIQRLDEVQGRLMNSMRQFLSRQGERLGALAGQLSALSPLAILQRGYAAVFEMPKRKLLKKAGDTQAGTELEIVLGQGKLLARVEKVQGS